MHTLLQENSGHNMYIHAHTSINAAYSGSSINAAYTGGPCSGANMEKRQGFGRWTPIDSYTVPLFIRQVIASGGGHVHWN